MACQTHPKKGRFKMKTLKERLSAKLSRNGGFTLVEMLIVVAIIAILIVVSIPVISNNLEKARIAADQANLRSAYGAAAAYFLAESGDPDSTAVFDEAGTEYAYKVNNKTHQGEIVPAGTGVTAGSDGFNYGLATGHVDSYVKVMIKASGEVEADWV